MVTWECTPPVSSPKGALQQLVGKDTSLSEAHMRPAAQGEAGLPWGGWQVREPLPE